VGTGVDTGDRGSAAGEGGLAERGEGGEPGRGTETGGGAAAVAGDSGSGGKGGAIHSDDTEGGVWQPIPGSGGAPEHPRACPGKLGLPSSPLEPGQVVLGTPTDFDGDGRLDVPLMRPFGVDLWMSQADGKMVSQGVIGFDGFNTLSTAVVDLNRDGRPDLIVASLEEKRVAVGLNSADSFPVWPQWQYLSVAGPTAMVAADLDGDHDPDLAVASYREGKVNVLLNDGKGKLTVGATYSVGPELSDIEALDLDDDGFPELLLTNMSRAAVEILVNHQGVFGIGPDYPANANPMALELADVDGDGRRDVLVANAGPPGGYSVLFNRAPGTLSVPSFHEAGAGTSALASGDLDRDGRVDVALLTAENLVTALNIGAGQMGAPALYSIVGSTPYSIVIADFNGDGWLDLASSTEAGAVVAYNLGDGAFHEQYEAPFAARALSPADYTGDGRVDLAVASTTGLSLFVGERDGALQVPAKALSSEPIVNVATADFDANGAPDLLVSRFDSPELLVLMNLGGGVFDASIPLLTSIEQDALLTGDFTGDELPDIVVRGSTGASLIANLGGGAFAEPLLVGSGGPAQVLAAADLNGDGRLDVMMANSSWSWEPKLRILLNAGGGRFSPFSSFNDSSALISAIAPVDLNRDGRVDLVVGDSGLGAIRVLWNHGAASFRDWAWQDFPNNGYGSLHAADMNNDGWPDLLQGTGSQLRVFLNAGDGTLTWPVAYAAGAMIERMVPQDLDGDGRVDVAIAGAYDGNLHVVRNACPRAVQRTDSRVDSSLTHVYSP
jgi:FG-GAP-like repeat